MMKKLILVVILILGCVGVSFANEYRIGAGDRLDIAVWGVDSLSVSVTVRPDGKVTIPAVGDVEAEGRTPEELSTELARSLSRYVKSPTVTVTVSEMTNNRVYISGGGVESQVMNLERQMTLFKLLASLEGIENTDLRRAYLLRNKEVIKKDFYDLFKNGDFTQDVDMMPEDILFIPSNEQNKIYVTGAVEEPQYLVYREGMKVLDAILGAGGLSEFASGNRVQVARKDGTKLRVRLDDLIEGRDPSQNIDLKPGDQIIVTEGLF